MFQAIQDILHSGVNQEIMDEVGIKSIDTKEDFMKYMKAVSKDGRFGYGGSWEKTYAFNELAQFVNMFGGDYFDWTKRGKQGSSSVPPRSGC